VIVWTIGHSTHAQPEFLGLLETHSIRRLADIRTVPKSRRHPHFHTEEMARSLPAAGVEYRHMAGLGGFRKARPDSPNAGWQNQSFRGYADHTQSAEFRDALEELCAWAADEPTAMMCSEGVWWRCHRRLVADQLVSAGWEVRHIAPDGRIGAHELTDFARVADGALVYPATNEQLDLL
jgi:uncharacterized protein (DUF488 family)